MMKLKILDNFYIKMEPNLRTLLTGHQILSLLDIVKVAKDMADQHKIHLKKSLENQSNMFLKRSSIIRLLTILQPKINLHRKKRNLTF